MHVRSNEINEEIKIPTNFPANANVGSEAVALELRAILEVEGRLHLFPWRPLFRKSLAHSKT